jgi:hypothetical protein
VSIIVEDLAAVNSLAKVQYDGAVVRQPSG